MPQRYGRVHPAKYWIASSLSRLLARFRWLDNLLYRFFIFLIAVDVLEATGVTSLFNHVCIRGLVALVRHFLLFLGFRADLALEVLVDSLVLLRIPHSQFSF